MMLLDTGAEFIITVLFNGIWQALLFALVAWLVLRTRPAANATTRHSVYAAACAASIVLPIVTAGVSLAHRPIAVAHGPLGRAAAIRSVPDRTAGPVPVLRRGLSRVDDRRWSPSAATPSSVATSRAKFSLPRSVARTIVVLWFGGALVALMRLAISMLHLERLKRNALPVGIAYRAKLPRWLAATQNERHVRLCRSDAIAVPIAVGLGDAMILVPETFLAELEPADIDAIVLHELAHLRRGDDWINALGRCAAALLFFNPAVLWLIAQLDLEREVACDDWVLQRADAFPYATCLARVVEAARWPYRAVTAPGAFVTRRGMSIRIERLLAKDRDVRVRTGAGVAAMTLVALVTLGIVAVIASPSIAYPVDPIALAAPLPAVRPHRVAVAAVPPRAVRPQPVVTAAAASLAAAKPVPMPTRMLPGRSIQAIAAEAKPDGVRAVADARQNVADAKADGVQAVADARQRVADVKADGVRAVADARQNVADAKADWVQAVADARQNVADAKADGTGAADRQQLVAQANAPDYIDELAGVGYTNLSSGDLVELKALGVTAAYIRELQAQGLRGLPVAALVQLRALSIGGDDVKAARNRFGKSASIDDIMSLKALGVSSDYVNALSATGLRNLTLDDVRSLRALDVMPAYVRSLVRAGYPDLTVEQVQQCRALGINGDTIARAAAHGFHHPSIDELLQLKATGVL